MKLPGILHNTQFLKIWGNQILLQVGMNMCNYTALLILADRTHSPFIQAIFYTSLTIPAFLFGLIAGPVVDMTDRKHLMLVTDILMALLFFAYAFTQGNIVGLVVIAFLTSSVARFFIPAEAATIPLIVSEETLEHANTFFLFTLMGSVLLGYAIAGPLIQFSGGLHTKGENVPFLVAGGMLLIGFLLRLSLKKISHVRPHMPDGSIMKKTLYLFWETVMEVKTSHRIAIPLVLLIFVELMVGMLSIVILEYVRRYLMLPLTSVTYVLMLPLIAGLIAGVALLGKAESMYGRRKTILFGILTTGFALAVLGIFPWIAGEAFLVLRTISVIAAFSLGIAVVFVAVQARTILQRNVRHEMHGRIFSFLDVMIAFVTPMPVLILGLLADKVSLLATLVFIGVGIIILSLLSSKVTPSRKV